MRLKSPPKAKAMIPTASMADIAFLLIIFFMVTTSHELDRTSVNLPAANTRIEAEKGAAIVVLAKKVDEAGTETLLYKFSDGDQTSWLVGGPEDIYLEASRIIAGNATRQFILKADGMVRFELIDELLDSMREGGVANVMLLTSQRTAPESGI
jgi:biopolymer transport protein ExbD